METVTSEKLMNDLRVVVGDAEDLLKATAGQTGEKVQQLRARTQESLANARARLEALGATAGERATEAARAVDRQVHENPWTAIGLAAGIGVIVGILIGRK
jgi:ElaB/YqjD/DUF883 family membrane-anchored ribosome-binding protein